MVLNDTGKVWYVYLKGKDERIRLIADYVDEKSEIGWLYFIKLKDDNKKVTVGMFNMNEVQAIVTYWI